jgi:peptidoglycan-N-acetylglucosamine deacetylase
MSFVLPCPFYTYFLVQGGNAMTKAKYNFIAFIVIVTVSIGSIKNPYTTSFVEQIKPLSIAASKQKDPLYIELKEKASKYEVKPKDAVLDPVWKATPGYNGRTVDIEASYNKMKKDGQFNEKMLVYKQIEPQVHLEDLPPAPVYRGNPEKPMVALLINVAWGNEYLPKMVSVLKKNGVHSTFFLEGNWVKKNPDLAKMLYDEGHELGNHSFSHPDMKSLSRARIQEQLQKTNEVIKQTVGVTPKAFAPPSGSYRDEVVKIANEMGMITILWSVDTVDWKKPDPTEMMNRVLRKVHPGAMILMHPTEPTAEGLELLIEGLKAKGYEIGTVSQLLSETRIDKK